MAHKNNRKDAPPRRERKAAINWEKEHPAKARQKQDVRIYVNERIRDMHGDTE